MEKHSYYEIAQKLEAAGYWRAVLPASSHSHLQEHLKSLESWNKFFSISEQPDQENIQTDSESETQEIMSEAVMRATRRKQLGEEGILSFRVRVLLFDVILCSIEPNSTTNMHNLLQNNYNFSYDDMYYTLECDQEDWNTVEEELENEKEKSTSEEPFSDLRTIDKPLFESSTKKSEQLKSNRNVIEMRNLLADVKTIKSWSNPPEVDTDKEGFEELYNGLDKTMTLLKAYEEHSYPFLTRVRKSEAADYYDIIKNPMDLSIMTKKIKRREYNSKKEFQDDLDLMFSNCRKYNTDPDSIYVTHANMLDKYAKKLLRKVRNIDCTEHRRAMGYTNTVLQNSSSTLKNSETIEDDSLSGKDTDPSDSEDNPVSCIADTLHEFLAEDPQIRSWRLFSLEPRIRRVRDAHARELSPFENWSCIDRTARGMLNYTNYYTNNSRVSMKHYYMPEYHICDVVPELPVQAPSNDMNCRPKTDLTSSQALLLLQQSLVVLLSQGGIHGSHKIPFEVLSDLLGRFFIEMGRTVQTSLNNLSSETDIVNLILEDSLKKISFDNLQEYYTTANRESRKHCELRIYEDNIFDISAPSPEGPEQPPAVSNVVPIRESYESPNIATYSFHNTSPKEEQPIRKKMRVSSKDSPKKKRGRPKKKRTSSP